MEPKITPEGDEVVEEPITPNPEEENPEGENPEGNEPSKIDYEAIRLQEEERAKKSDPEIAKLAFLKREEKRKQEEEQEEDKPLTRKELAEFFAQNNATTQKILTESQALAIARANTTSEAEAQAALTYWKNRIIPTGNIEEDVLFAIGGLNRNKLISQNKEIARALKAKDGISNNPASSHRDAPQGSEPKLSANDAVAIKSSGFVWDGKMRLYKKKLGGEKSNKYLYFDVKSKRTWAA